MKSSSELGDGDRVRNKGDRGGEEGADVAEADPRPFLLVGAGESEWRRVVEVFRAGVDERDGTSLKIESSDSVTSPASPSRFRIPKGWGLSPNLFA